MSVMKFSRNRFRVVSGSTKSAKCVDPLSGATRADDLWQERVRSMRRGTIMKNEWRWVHWNFQEAAIPQMECPHLSRANSIIPLGLRRKTNGKTASTLKSSGTQAHFYKTRNTLNCRRERGSLIHKVNWFIFVCTPFILSYDYSTLFYIQT